MIRYVFWETTKFERQYKRLIKNNLLLRKKIGKVLNIMSVDPFADKLRTHAVGNVSEYGTIWSSRVNGDIRIIWAFAKNRKDIIILTKVGGHDDVY